MLTSIILGVGLLGLLVTAILYVHVSAKYVFVRILRGTKHFQNPTWVHFSTWGACTVGLSAIAFLLAQSIPIFDYILGLAGAVGFAPLAIMLPAYLWLHDFGDYRRGTTMQKVKFYLHCAMFLVGTFMCVGGTYGVIQSVINAYADGRIGQAFSCADNSGSV
jgi:hypothetical protein